MAVGIFLCSMDGTIVVSCEYACTGYHKPSDPLVSSRTAYAAIGSELNQLQNTSWIATSYLLTVAAFQYVRALRSIRSVFRLGVLIHPELSWQGAIWKIERYLWEKDMLALLVHCFCRGMPGMRVIAQYDGTDREQSVLWHWRCRYADVRLY